jgi:hypothetical protein
MKRTNQRMIRVLPRLTNFCYRSSLTNGRNCGTSREFFTDAFVFEGWFAITTRSVREGSARKRMTEQPAKSPAGTKSAPNVNLLKQHARHFQVPTIISTKPKLFSWRRMIEAVEAVRERALRPTPFGETAAKLPAPRIGGEPHCGSLSKE